MDYNLNIISEEPAALNSKDKKIVWRVSKMKLAFKYKQKLKLKVNGWAIAISSILCFGIDGETNTNFNTLGFIVAIIGLTIVFAGYKLKDKLWILDRTNQDISIPLSLKGKPIIRPIHDTKSSFYAVGGGTDVVIPVVWHNSERVSFSSLYSSKLPRWWSEDKHISSKNRARTWSFFIWYLDRNRPLPPGDILDPFREEDFLRRKAEGFPPPLFCSCVPTPEITPEQQAEREKHWKDEDYIFRLERYKNPSIWDNFDDDETIPLQLEKGATIIHQANSPDNWTRKPYPEFENFRYLPTAYAMRYQYNDGRIFYALIDKKTEEVYTPPTEEKYKKEIIRYKRNTIE